MYGEVLSDEDNRAESLLNRVSASLVTRIANLAWKTFQAINTRIPEGELPHPLWAPGRIAKSRERSVPPLGFPRETESLCPRCVPEIRKKITQREISVEELIKTHPGEIKARLLEESGRILMRKDSVSRYGVVARVARPAPVYLVTQRLRI